MKILKSTKGSGGIQLLGSVAITLTVTCIVIAAIFGAVDTTVFGVNGSAGANATAAFGKVQHMTWSGLELGAVLLIVIIGAMIMNAMGGKSGD
jgi:hypothetical protein